MGVIVREIIALLMQVEQVKNVTNETNAGRKPATPR